MHEPESADAPFLLHPASAAFLAGDPAATRERLTPRRDALDWLLLAGLLAIGLFVLVTGVGNPKRQEGLLVGLLMLAVAGYLQVTRSRYLRARRRLATAGRTIRGEVVAAHGEEGAPTENEFGVERVPYRVEVDYRFTSPGGEEITDRDEATWDDRGALPEPGTPVLVLVLDDRHYALL